MGWLQQKKEEKKRRQMLARIDNQHLAYATMRLPDGTEKVLGKNGSVNLTDTEIMLRVGEIYAFRGDLDQTQVGELMSLNGVTVRGLDKESGEERTVVGYYSYHRK